MIALALIVGYVFNFKAWGRHLFAIGGNEQAARLTGVPVDWIKFQAYVFSAFTASFASLLLLGYNGSAINAMGQGYELRVIAATVIGGANLMGGAGTAFGAFDRFGLSRGHPQCLVDGRHRFQLAGRIRRRLHHSRGASRHANRRQVDRCGHFGAVVAEKAPLETEFTAGNPVKVNEEEDEMKRFLLGTAIAFGAMSVADVRCPGEICLRFGAEEHEQPVLRSGARRLQEGRSGIEGRLSNACISAPANTAAATSKCRSCRISSPRRSTALPCRRPMPRPWPWRCKRPRMPAFPFSPGTPTCCLTARICALAYIGTHNYEIGVNLAKLAMQIKPKGGTVCIQSGGAAAANHNERMQGIRDTLSGKKSAASPGDRLTGQNGWTEIDGCPLYTNDDFPRSVQQFDDIMAKNPNLDAFIPTGGFPQFIPDANRAAVGTVQGQDRLEGTGPRGGRHPAGADRPDEGRPVARPGRPASVRNGLQDDDGAASDMKDGKPAPADPTYTGLDVCTPETVDTCIAK